MDKLLPIASLSLFVVLYYILKRFKKIKKRDFVNEILGIENGRCYYCQSLNPQNVYKDGFWTYLKCPICKKTSQIHVKH